MFLHVSKRELPFPERVTFAQLVEHRSVMNTNSIDVSSEISTRTDDGRGRVLVVDDERLNRAILARVLKQNGYSVVEAEDGAEALNKIEHESIDLVLLDIVMPGLSGFDVLAKIRSRKHDADLPVIMVTASTESDKIVQAFNAGANDYVTKPIDIGVTMARINTHVALRDSLAALRRSEERYALVVQATNDGFWDWDLIADTVHFSPRWIEMLGLSEEKVEPSINSWLDRVYSEDRARVEAEFDSHLSGVTPQFETELRMLHADGSYRWMLCRGLAVKNSAGRLHRLAGSLTDITEGKVADALTGLPNRVLFQERLQKCVERHTRDQKSRFALLYLDLDNFKLVNDGLGHEIGDRLLVSVARRLEGSVRSGEAFVSRLGGDEFAVLLENVQDIQDASRAAERILIGLAEPFALGGGREVFASVSCGISMASEVNRESADMLQEADTAMYQAKEQGKSCFKVFDPRMKTDVKRRLKIENELRRAVERDEFVLHYQPIVSMATGGLVGFEALVRWQNPETGLISPAEFIPIAEDTGLIIPIGRWVLAEACRQMAEWRATDSRFDGIMMSVNLSSRQLSDTDLVSDVSSVLIDTGLPAKDIILEVTESTIIENQDAGARTLNRLRQCGVNVAIDDFGTGYSSLAYLHRLPLDTLKIDQSFVDRMTHSDDNHSIILTIVALANRLQLKVVAEGIETQKQQELLNAMGCQLAQGYFFSPPIPADKVPDFAWPIGAPIANQFGSVENIAAVE